MGRIRPKWQAALVLMAAVAVGVAAATALAAVTVYKNGFSKKGEVKELRQAQGKHCKRSFRKKAGKVRIDVTRGSEVCGYRPPVEGDTDGPDHSLQVAARFLRSTPKGLRKDAYVAVFVRSGKTSDYELRIFPVKHRFRLVRSPSGGGSGFPAQGRSPAIKGFNKLNVLELKAVGSRVTARVNGTKIATVTDSDPAQVGGRRLEIAVANGKRSDKTVSATIDKLKVQVPTP